MNPRSWTNRSRLTGPLPLESAQRCNVLFGQTLPFAVKVHPLIAQDAAPKPFTPSIDFDPRVITSAFRDILDQGREVITRPSLGKDGGRAVEFNDLLGKEGIDPKTVLVLRHRPKQREFRKVLPWLAAERPDIYNAYQQQQSLSVEPAMVKADFVASFIGHEAGKALFIGLYRRGQWRPLTHDEYWRVPANIEMRAFGMLGPDRESILWFDLAPTAFYQDWKGRLIVAWPPPERSWWRWADRNRIVVSTIHEQSILDAAMPRWDELRFTWDELKVLPSKWKAALSQWRGIYFIFDQNDGKGYVGSAYGTENILGRWLSYAAGGHGGNKELRKRDPTHFRFSILQRVSPDMEPTEIIRLESSWKDRLHTREFGMNEN